MKTPEEAIDLLEKEAIYAKICGRDIAAERIREAVKLLRPLAMQDRERLALAQHWES